MLVHSDPQRWVLGLWMGSTPPCSGDPKLSPPSAYRTSAAKMWSFGAAQGMNGRQQQASPWGRSIFDFLGLGVPTKEIRGEGLGSPTSVVWGEYISDQCWFALSHPTSLCKTVPSNGFWDCGWDPLAFCFHAVGTPSFPLPLHIGPLQPKRGHFRAA